MHGCTHMHTQYTHTCTHNTHTHTHTNTCNFLFHSALLPTLWVKTFIFFFPFTVVDKDEQTSVDGAFKIFIPLKPHFGFLLVLTQGWLSVVIMNKNQCTNLLLWNLDSSASQLDHPRIDKLSFQDASNWHVLSWLPREMIVCSTYKEYNK